MTTYAPTTFKSLLLNPESSRSLQRFWDLLNPNPTLGTEQQWLPAVDITETEKEYEISMSLAGFKKEDIKLEVNEQLLTVTGERKWQSEEGKTYHRVETGYGAFVRSFQLPSTVKLADIQARFENGILHLVLVKDDLSANKRQIAIQ